MKSLRLVAAALVFAAIVALLVLGGLGGAPGGSNDSGTASAAPSLFASSDSCEQCHPDVFAEWQGSYHSQSFVDPLVRDMSGNFQNKDCIPCHSPRPVYEIGIGTDARVVPRTANRHQGVDCLSCHRMDDSVTASRQGLSGACNPVYEPRMKQMDQCAPCHDQHGTISEEWGHSKYVDLGMNCITCHMPDVERPARNGRPGYTGKSHAFPGAHDVDLLRAAFTMSHQADGQRLVVTMTNDGAGHHIPTDARHRALDVIVTLYDVHGGPIGSNESRDSGQEPGTHRWRLRNPYRTEVGKEDTRLPSGESRDFEVPLEGRDAQRAKVQVIYKLTPYRADTEGFLLYEQDIELDT